MRYSEIIIFLLHIVNDKEKKFKPVLLIPVEECNKRMPSLKVDSWFKDDNRTLKPGVREQIITTLFPNFIEFDNTHMKLEKFEILDSCNAVYLDNQDNLNAIKCDA